MIAAYKDRKLNISQKVDVYRNLHNNLFSIRCSKTKLVLAHGEDFMLRNASSHVSESGRQRVLNKKIRNVHAWITGELRLLDDDWLNSIYDEAYYNPYKLSQFVTKEDMQPLGEYDVDFAFSDGKSYLIH